MSWNEPACLHLLVLIIGHPPLSTAHLSIADQWLKLQSGTRTVIPVLLPSVSRTSIMVGQSPWFTKLQSPAWGGSPDALARIVLAEALHGERPRLFLSYRRADTAALADQLFDALTAAGCSVYLDRFTNSPGRYFPDELAEELAEKTVILVLESDNLPLSKWTLWEIAFARRFGLGHVALNCDHAPQIKGIFNADRKPVTRSAQGKLTASDLDSAVTFLLKRHAVAALSRSAFYQELIRQAAARRGGSVNTVAGGLYEARNWANTPKAIILPAGRPGQLGDAHRLVTSTSGFPSVPLILAGQHQHLPWTKRQSLEWLAKKTSIELLDAYACYRELMRTM